jgi:cytochrome c oxidase subunit IV
MGCKTLVVLPTLQYLVLKVEVQVVIRYRLTVAFRLDYNQSSAAFAKNASVEKEKKEG